MGDVKERRRRNAEAMRKSRALQPVEFCGTGGCEFQTKRKGDMQRHQESAHEG
jgi:hypothetical protein